jgi:hypothetical protein
MKGTQLVLKAQVDCGVKFVFGYTGGAIMPEILTNAGRQAVRCRRPGGPIHPRIHRHVLTVDLLVEESTCGGHRI